VPARTLKLLTSSNLNLLNYRDYGLGGKYSQVAVDSIKNLDYKGINLTNNRMTLEDS